MDKVAAYQSGVVEGLKELNLPEEIKLAAAQYLFKVADDGTGSDASRKELRSLGVDSGIQGRLMALEAEGKLPSASDSPYGYTEEEETLADINRLASSEAERQELLDLMSKNKDSRSKGEQKGGVRDIDARLMALRTPEGDLLSALRNNPGLAAAAGLGAAGLGYGAYRALS